jgi:hypothetical protein
VAYDKTVILNIEEEGSFQNAWRLLRKHNPVVQPFNGQEWRLDLNKLDGILTLWHQEGGMHMEGEVMTNRVRPPVKERALQGQPFLLETTFKEVEAKENLCQTLLTTFREGVEAPGREGNERRILYSVPLDHVNKRTAPDAVKAAIEGLTQESRLMIVCHGSWFNYKTKAVADWLNALKFAGVKKISLIVCDAALSPNRAADDLREHLGEIGKRVAEITARKGEVLVREDGTKFVHAKGGRFTSIWSAIGGGPTRIDGSAAVRYSKKDGHTPDTYKISSKP